jgi:hypothetical protein
MSKATTVDRLLLSSLKMSSSRESTASPPKLKVRKRADTKILLGDDYQTIVKDIPLATNKCLFDLISYLKAGKQMWAYLSNNQKAAKGFGQPRKGGGEY